MIRHVTRGNNNNIEIFDPLLYSTDKQHLALKRGRFDHEAFKEKRQFPTSQSSSTREAKPSTTHVHLLFEERRKTPSTSSPLQKVSRVSSESTKRFWSCRNLCTNEWLWCQLSCKILAVDHLACLAQSCLFCSNTVVSHVSRRHLICSLHPSLCLLPHIISVDRQNPKTLPTNSAERTS